MDRTPVQEHVVVRGVCGLSVGVENHRVALRRARRVGSRAIAVWLVLVRLRPGCAEESCSPVGSSVDLRGWRLIGAVDWARISRARSVRCTSPALKPDSGRPQRNISRTPARTRFRASGV
jgi:hypothetical protein